MSDELTGILSPGGEVINVTSKLEEIGEHPFGKIFGESCSSAGLKKSSDPKLMPRLIVHNAKVDNKDIVVHYHVRVRPPIINPDVYYPSKVIVMTQETYSLADHIPQDSWKQYALIDENKQAINIGGSIPMVFYYTQVVIQQVDEDDEFKAVPGPFIKGSDIINKQSTKNQAISLIGVGGQSFASAGQDRQRIEDDESVHIIA